MGKFKSESITPEKEDAITRFALKFLHIEELARRFVKPGRNLSLALTHLEDASMRINKAIAEDGLLDADSVETKDD